MSDLGANDNVKWGIVDVVNQWAGITNWKSEIDAIFPQEAVNSLEELYMNAPLVVS